MELYLVRHGETIWNQEKRMQGHLTSPLTPAGQKQATLLGQALRSENLTHIYLSSSPRVAETYALMAPFITGEPTISPLLQEINMGSWEGQKADQIARLEPTDWHTFWQQPEQFTANNGGETFSQLAQRCQAFLALLAQHHAEDKILIVSHRLTIRSLINQLQHQELNKLGALPDVLPNSLSKLTWHENTATIQTYSDISHYEAIESKNN